MRVKSLGFAEIKGTAILPRERIRVGPGGVAEDRRFAAVEADGGAVLRTAEPGAAAASSLGTNRGRKTVQRRVKTLNRQSSA
ncbi:hypothetical protein, partial [Arachnia propionica]|uniref:hypothetical protein n=1 Tax=Arachnia propionica TaxID=1750 RepID=UPI003C6ECC7B